jgi:hypothetical protein
MANKVAKTDDKDLVPVSNPGFDYGEFSHAGFEETTMEDLSIPFVNLLQSNSPAVIEEDSDFKAGMLMNSVTKEVMKQPVILIPVFKEAAVVEWVPRLKGGGLVARHGLKDSIFLDAIEKNGGSRIPPKDADGKRVQFKSPDGNDLVETYYVYCLIMNETGTETEGYCVLSFSSTKIKVHKDWITAMYTQKGRPPIFANRCRLFTTRQQNDSGQPFYNFAISPMKDTWRESLINPANEQERALLKEASDFATMIQDGIAKPDYESVKGEEGSGGSGEEKPKGPLPMDSEDMPF